MKICRPWISELADNEVFVFGSNEAGRHGKGAAKQALQWGAKYGCAEGPSGKTFAIPTVDKHIRNKLSLDAISWYVNLFIEYVKIRPYKEFLLTEIGCGLAGWTVEDIAPLFAKAINLPNIQWPKRFADYLPNLPLTK